MANQYHENLRIRTWIFHVSVNRFMNINEWQIKVEDLSLTAC